MLPHWMKQSCVLSLLMVQQRQGSRLALWATSGVAEACHFHSRSSGMAGLSFSVWYRKWRRDVRGNTSVGEVASDVAAAGVTGFPL